MVGELLFISFSVAFLSYHWVKKYKISLVKSNITSANSLSFWDNSFQHQNCLFSLMGRKKSSPWSINTSNSSSCKTKINTKKGWQMFTKIWAQNHLDLHCTEIEEYYRTLGLYKDEFYHTGVQSSLKFTVFSEKGLRYLLLFCVCKWEMRSHLCFWH